jgi:hypothetical protein
MGCNCGGSRWTPAPEAPTSDTTPTMNPAYFYNGPPAPADETAQGEATSDPQSGAVATAEA